MMVHGTAEITTTRPYHVIYVGRKSTRQYRHSHEAVLKSGGGVLSHHQPIEGVFAAAIGNYGYILRSADLDELIKLAKFIQE